MLHTVRFTIAISATTISSSTITMAITTTHTTTRVCVADVDADNVSETRVIFHRLKASIPEVVATACATTSRHKTSGRSIIEITAGCAVATHSTDPTPSPPLGRR